MQKYFAYKNEIEGVNDVKETLKVIEKSAASNIHLLRDRVVALREYKKNSQEVISRLSRFYWDNGHPLFKPNSSSKKSLFVITGNKGIVGGLYHDIVSIILEGKEKYETLFVAGGKGMEYLKEEGVSAELVPVEISEFPEAEEIEKISSMFFDKFLNNEVGQIDIMYPQFISLGEQEPATAQFLPFNISSFTGEMSRDSSESDGWPIFEPSPKAIFDTLLNKYVSIFLTQIILEAKLSEFSARTVTAEDALTKTDKLIKKLELEFFKERRKVVTQKQLESFTVHQVA